MKKYLFSVVAIAAMLAMSAFTVVKETSKVTTSGFFYKFIGDVSDPDQFSDPELWERAENDCVGDVHVCGVLLPSDATLGAHPDSGELANAVPDITQSEENSSPSTADIIMRN